MTQAQREQIHALMNSERAQWKRPEGAGPGKNPMAALENPGDPGYAAAVQAAKQRASERIQATAAELNALLPSILDKAFTAPPPRIYDQLTETR